MLLWKNKSKSFAIKYINMTGLTDNNGTTIKMIPSLDFWFNEGVVIGIYWLCWGIEVWKRDVTDLV